MNHTHYAALRDSFQIWNDKTVLESQQLKIKKVYNENRKKNKDAKRHNADNSPNKQNRD